MIRTEVARTELAEVGGEGGDVADELGLGGHHGRGALWLVSGRICSAKEFGFQELLGRAFDFGADGAGLGEVGGVAGGAGAEVDLAAALGVGAELLAAAGAEGERRGGGDD
jgi:hypothetical protein